VNLWFKFHNFWRLFDRVSDFSILFTKAVLGAAESPDVYPESPDFNADFRNFSCNTLCICVFASIDLESAF